VANKIVDLYEMKENSQSRAIPIFVPWLFDAPAIDKRKKIITELINYTFISLTPNKKITKIHQKS